METVKAWRVVVSAMEGATEQQAVRGAAGDVLPEPTDTQTTIFSK